ncbi:MAG: short-chain fatty acyl-CoA regulator family protein [Polyangiales bacterium]
MLTATAPRPRRSTVQEGKQFNASIGARLRALRLERHLTQADIAKRLGVSPAYLNLIEKGRRSAQLPLLWKALEIFGVEVEPFMASLGEARVDEGLAKLLEEPLLRSLDVDEKDLQAMSAEPKTATTIAALFNLYKNTRAQLDELIYAMRRDEEARMEKRAVAAFEGDDAPRFEHSPFDEVIDFLEAHRNWFPELEEEADRLRLDSGLTARRVLSDDLIRVLERNLGTRVVVEPMREGTSVVRRHDPASGVLTLSSGLLEQRLKFQLAHAAGLRVLDERRLDAAITRDFRPRHTETPKLLKIHLANYFAGALLLPYGDFFKEVQRTRYDVELLANVFETSYETVAHRVCNLADPRRRGVPWHFQRVDVAGNVSKRYSATGLKFPHGSGGCPKWAVHVSFLTPSVITKQYSVFPDGSLFFCFAKVTPAPVQGSLVRGTVYSIGLGTHAENAKHLVYADDVPFSTPQDLKKMAIPVGVTCRFCERTDCNQRAAPSYKFHYAIDEYTKKDNFFSPLTHKGE